MNKQGFTLIEVLVAMFILLFVLLGFFGWACTIILNNTTARKINTANMFALDLADRLRQMPDNDLVRPKKANQKRVGYTDSGNLKQCIGNIPKSMINVDTNGMTDFTNPAGKGALYLYDGNSCSNANMSCYADSLITESANAHIDHPNASTDPAVISPVRFMHNTTFYAVWSVAYVPCTISSFDKRKIFITVYWIDPEPEEKDPAEVLANMASGTYRLKNVSLVIDKWIGAAS